MIACALLPTGCLAKLKKPQHQFSVRTNCNNAIDGAIDLGTNSSKFSAKGRYLLCCKESFVQSI